MAEDAVVVSCMFLVLFAWICVGEQRFVVESGRGRSLFYDDGLTGGIIQNYRPKEFPKSSLADDDDGPQMPPSDSEEEDDDNDNDNNNNNNNKALEEHGA